MKKLIFAVLASVVLSTSANAMTVSCLYSINGNVDVQNLETDNENFYGDLFSVGKVNYSVVTQSEGAGNISIRVVREHKGVKASVESKNKPVTFTDGEDRVVVTCGIL